MSVHVCLVGPNEIPGYWQQICAAYDGYPGMEAYFTLEELAALLFNPVSGYYLWLCIDENKIEGMIVTAVLRYPRKLDVHIAACCGEGLNKYLGVGLKNIEQWAALCGATDVVFDGRDGWLRAAKKFGYVPVTRMKKNVRVMWGH